MNNTDWNQKTIQELEDFLQHIIALPGTEKYDASYQGWAATGNLPALLCLCETTEDVQAAVILARKKDLAISVRGGGHDWQGRSFAHRGLVVDLTNLNTIEINASDRTATVGGGVTSQNLLTAADPFGLIAVAGNCGEVGIAGFSFGGGYGLTSPSHGLAADNILAAEVVLADGQVIHTSRTENPDLLWGLTGGGGTFGVVTSLRIRLHAAKPLLAGFILFPLSEIEMVLKGYTDIAESSPDELFMVASIKMDPDGNHAVMIAPVWYGDPEEGQRFIDMIRKTGHPVKEQVTETRMKDLVASYAAYIFHGDYHYVKSRWMPNIPGELISELSKAITKLSSTFSTMSIYYLHGVPTRVLLEDTAFGLRVPHHIFAVDAEWTTEDTANVDVYKKWVNAIHELTSNYALPGGYLGFLGNEDQKQLNNAYGSNLSRLMSTREKFDPEGVFSRERVPLAGNTN